MAGREGINRLLAAMEGEPQAAEVARMSSIIQRASLAQARETVEDLQEYSWLGGGHGSEISGELSRARTSQFNGRAHQA